METGAFCHPLAFSHIRVAPDMGCVPLQAIAKMNLWAADPHPGLPSRRRQMRRRLGRTFKLRCHILSPPSTNIFMFHIAGSWVRYADRNSIASARRFRN
jgi:hypothetical protein